MNELVDKILAYERAVGPHRSGSFSGRILRAIAASLPPHIETSMETGSGKSTILLSNLSDRHIVFTADDRACEKSSVLFSTNCPLLRTDRTEIVLGPTQLTLPSYKFDALLDIAILDGPHGYPFPELEYYYLYPHLKKGGLLIVDDLHIPSVGNMFSFLREDAMFNVVWIKETTGMLKRTEEPCFDPLGDGWWLQSYNVTRFRAPPKSFRTKMQALLRIAGLYEPIRNVYRKVHSRVPLRSQ